MTFSHRKKNDASVFKANTDVVKALKANCTEIKRGLTGIAKN
jgi:hypothetical protein